MTQESGPGSIAVLSGGVRRRRPTGPGPVTDRPYPTNSKVALSVW